MFAREAKDTKIHLTDEQMLRQVESSLQNAILIESDEAILNEYKRMKARLRKKGMKQRINKEFIDSFMMWLTGRSKYNQPECELDIRDENGATIFLAVCLAISFLRSSSSFSSGVSLASASRC